MATNTVQNRSFKTINDNSSGITSKSTTKQVTVLKSRYNEDFIDLLGEL